MRAVRLAVWTLSGILLAGTPSSAASLAGDLDGDGQVGLPDMVLLYPLFGASSGSPTYDPAADLSGDGMIGLPDLAALYAPFGSSGDPDTTPPGLLVTLNDIRDDMNDVLVVPPDGFLVTIDIDGQGGSLIDTASLSIKSLRDIGSHPAGTELAPLFQVTPTRAVWEVPAGSNLERTTHGLVVRVRDLAGNEAEQEYLFAVRDFVAGPPLGNLQTLFVDFDQDRNLGPEIDFLESLHEFGLSSPALAASGDESWVRDEIVALILERVHAIYGRNADGSPGPDAVNVVFLSTPPGVPHSRICVGGQSPQGGSYLGAATMDKNNLVETSDECATAGLFGVFPHAIDNLWGSAAGYQSAFGGVDPDLGGMPFGADPLDAALLAPDFDLLSAPPAEVQRFFEVVNAVDAFAAIVSVAIAHEVGHMLGLVAHGPAPAGLWGGSGGGNTDHNVTTSGAHPLQNFVMNAGTEFSFNEITGRGGESTPVFRPLNWAYLRDRVALNDDVTELLPPPVIDSVLPALLVFSTSPENQQITLAGDHFAPPASVELVDPQSPLPMPSFGVTVVDPQTLTAMVNRYFVAPGLYDVRLVNGDGQVSVLEQALQVVFQ